MPKQEPAGPETRLKIVDAADAPTIYADGCLGGGHSGPNIMLTFAVRAVDHKDEPPTPYALTNLRLVLPLEAAKALAGFINSIATPVAVEDAPPEGSSIQ